MAKKDGQSTIEGTEDLFGDEKKDEKGTRKKVVSPAVCAAVRESHLEGFEWPDGMNEADKRWVCGKLHAEAVYLVSNRIGALVSVLSGASSADL